MITERPRTYGKLLSENESLRKRLEEAEQTVEAIRNGEALRESEARFRNLLLALPAAVYTTDQEGRITLFNDQAAQLWGRRPEIGKDLWCGSWRIFRPGRKPAPAQPFPQAGAPPAGRRVR